MTRSRSATLAWALVLATIGPLAAGLTSCRPDDESETATPRAAAGAPRAETGTPALRVASSEPLPARFGFGRPATPEEIAALDIDIMPDGTGLPAGSARPPDGAPIYLAKCARCHGLEGEGGLNEKLVGRRPGDAFDFEEDPALWRERTIGSWWPYATTLFDYIRRAMPFDEPGSLSDREVYALVAWLLWRNEIIGETDVIDAETLPQVEMPAHARFVPDDRETSTVVR
jgi:S-disulfanyl-L-cysteine oxidoreductase SoxD